MSDNNIISPFKLFDAYEREDRDLFFGRDTEIDDLYSKVIHNRLTLLYGLSGTGKTSLIRCGLASCFDESDWFELYVRRDKNIMASLEKAIKSNTVKIFREEDFSLIEGVRNLFLENFKPIYLIFDQFEELFIEGSFSEIKQFIDFLQQLIASDIHCRVLISMREEYYVNLDMFEEKIPNVFDSRMRLENMTNKDLRDVLFKIADNSSVAFIKREKTVRKIIKNLSPARKDKERLVEQLIKTLDLSDVKKIKRVGDKVEDLIYIYNNDEDVIGINEEEVVLQIIEELEITDAKKIKEVRRLVEDLPPTYTHTRISLPYMQVYLQKLFDASFKEDGTAIFDTDLIKKVGKLDDVLGEFLEDQLKAIEEALGNKEFALQLLDSLITNEGTKKVITIQELQQKYPNA